MTTLIVGCSFCSTLGKQKSDQWQLNPDVVVRATPGTGNQAMAARVAYECAQAQYDRVIVIWTGINRLDTMITRNLHETYPGARKLQPEYSFCTPLTQSVWYHSGGQAGSWTWDSTCPPEIRQIFKTQYLGANSTYLTDISLCNIFYTQSFLEKLDIDYQMSFIYDPFFDYSKTSHEHYFGTVDPDSAYYKLVDWTKIPTSNTVFEWASQDHARLESDQLHPTRNSMREWINFTFGIDIAQ